MNRTRLFIFIAVLLCCNFGMAQDSYREAVKAYLGKDFKSLDMLEKLKPALTEVNKEKMNPFDEAESERLIQKFSEECLPDILMENWILPAFQKNITEAELKELAAIYETPEGKRFKEMTENILDDEKSQEDFAKRMVSNLMLTMMGGTPDPVKPNRGISKNYIKLFNQYYDESGVENTFSSLMDKIVELGAESNISKTILKDFMKSITKDMRNTMLNSVSKKWTEEDLMNGIKFASLPAYKHQLNAITDLTGMMTKESMESLGEKIAISYMDFSDKELKLSPEKTYYKARSLEDEGKMKEAYPLLLESAKEGYAPGQLHLGWWYYNGRYVVKDMKKAFDWMMKAAEQGDPNAEDWVGSMYEAGEGVEKNPEQAFIWYKKSVEHEFSNALCHLGNAYENGIGTTKDYKKAIECYQKAIEREEYLGLYHMGLVYYLGHGVPKNLPKAFEWMLKAGEKGIVRAYPQLEYMYSAGIGTKRDLERAAYWKIKLEEAQKNQ